MTRCTTVLYRKGLIDHNSCAKLTARFPWAIVRIMHDRPILSSTSTDRLPWSPWLRLIRFRNQTGTALLLLPVCWALVLAARGLPSWELFAIFTAGAFLMRSAGVILNDLADQSFDRRVTRTKSRPLASGELTRAQASVLLALLLAAAGLLLVFLNPLTRWLAPIAVALAALYPFAKRFIHIPQAILGIAFGWGTIMAWTATRNTVEPQAWIVFAATAVWAIAYDTIYAVQDQEDDRRIGVKSSALLFGSALWMAVGLALGTMLVLLVLAGRLADIGWAYYLALGAVGIFFAVQSAALRNRVDPPQAFRMFQAHVWAGAAILAGLVAGFLL